MKVLVVADAVGGVFTYAVELARALASRGVEVVVATEGAEPTADQRRALAAIPGLVHEARPFRLEWMEDPWDDVAAAGRWLLEVEARTRPDVIHSNAYAHGALPSCAPKLVVGHSCVVSWFEAVRGAPPPPRWDRYRAVVRAGLCGAAAVVAPSAWMAAALVRHHGPLGAPHVVPNGRDPARFRPGPKDELVLGAGRVWDEAKNAAALVRVAPRLPWPVAIAGEGTSPGAGRDATTTTTTTTATTTPTATATTTTTGAATGTQARPPGAPLSPPCGEGGWGRGEARRPTPTATEDGGGPRAWGGSPGPARLLGRLAEDELARWYSRAAIFAHPARYEPFGLAVLEAALSGCALVLADLPSLRENWDGLAEFAPPDDDEALRDRIAALVRDRARRVSLAARARARALELGPGRMAERYLALYRALAAARTERP